MRRGVGTVVDHRKVDDNGSSGAKQGHTRTNRDERGKGQTASGKAALREVEVCVKVMLQSTRYDVHDPRANGVVNMAIVATGATSFAHHPSCFVQTTCYHI